MVTGEFYIKKGLFPGFGRPFVFYAEILQRFVQVFPECFHLFPVLHRYFSINPYVTFFLGLDVHRKMLQGLL